MPGPFEDNILSSNVKQNNETFKDKILNFVFALKIIHSCTQGWGKVEARGFKKGPKKNLQILLNKNIIKRHFYNIMVPRPRFFGKTFHTLNPCSSIELSNNSTHFEKFFNVICDIQLISEVYRINLEKNEKYKKEPIKFARLKIDLF